MKALRSLFRNDEAACFWSTLVGLIPCGIALLLGYSGFEKALYPAEVTLALESLRMPRYLAEPAALIAGLIEVNISVLLAIELYRRRAAKAAMFLFTCYTVFLFYISTFSDPPSCGCAVLSTMFSSNTQNAIFGIARNVGFLYMLSIYLRDGGVVFASEQHAIAG